MLKLFLLLTLLLPFTAIQASNFYFWTITPEKLSDTSFKNTVVPQLHGLVQDYYQCIRRINEVQADILEVRSKLFEVWQEWEKIIHTPKKNRGDLLPELTKIYQIAREADKKILIATQKRFFSTESANAVGGIDSIIILLKYLDEMSEHNYRLLHQLDLALIQISESTLRPDLEQKISLELTNMIIKAELTINNIGDKKISWVFYQAWVNFVKNIEQNIVIGKNKRYLFNNLESINMGMKAFNQALTGTSLNPPQGALISLQSMQGRWNSILRLLLN